MSLYYDELGHFLTTDPLFTSSLCLSEAMRFPGTAPRLWWRCCKLSHAVMVHSPPRLVICHSYMIASPCTQQTDAGSWQMHSRAHTHARIRNTYMRIYRSPRQPSRAIVIQFKLQPSSRLFSSVNRRALLGDSSVCLVSKLTTLLPYPALVTPKAITSQISHTTSGLVLSPTLPEPSFLASFHIWSKLRAMVDLSL